MKPPYRAEHIGSLPRSERLMTARTEYQNGKISRQEFTEIEDECIAEAIGMQERSGIDVITDGEYRKRGWREFFYDKVEGFGPETVERDFPVRLADGTLVPMVREPKVTAKLRRREPLTAGDFERAKRMTRKSLKATLPTPTISHFFPGDRVLGRDVYRNADELLDDAATVLREELSDLASRGCSYVS